MKVLFVASGNKKYGLNPFVKSQASSLRDAGIDLIVYPIVGKGFKGYFSNIFKLRKFIKEQRPEIIHAHYSQSGLLASICTRIPVITSILGSFPKGHSLKRFWVKLFIRYIWASTIVKSERTASQLGIKSLTVIPNGVNIDLFRPIDFEKARKLCGFDERKKYVIFVSNPARIEKNFSLAEHSVKLLGDDSVELIPVFDKPHKEIVKFMSAADALILTSISEGSPNVVKEAMACNCPITSTDCGDVSWIIEGVKGCYIAKTYKPEDVSDALRQTLSHQGRTNGREKLFALGLTENEVAIRLIDIYSSVI